MTYRFVVENNKGEFVKGFGSLTMALFELQKINGDLEYLVKDTRSEKHYLND